MFLIYWYKISVYQITGAFERLISTDILTNEYRFKSFHIYKDSEYTTSFRLFYIVVISLKNVTQHFCINTLVLKCISFIWFALNKHQWKRTKFCSTLFVMWHVRESVMLIVYFVLLHDGLLNKHSYYVLKCSIYIHICEFLIVIPFISPGCV